MKREIKFRAWDKSKKIMVYVDNLSPFGMFMTWDGTVYEQGRVLPYIMLQYTGLKDRNGKEIFEGDILESGKRTNWKVVFFKGSFKMFFDNDKTEMFIHEMVKIVGNIFENPELCG